MIKYRLKNTYLVSSKSKLKQSLSGAVDLQQCILGIHSKWFFKRYRSKRVMQPRDQRPVDHGSKPTCPRLKGSVPKIYFECKKAMCMVAFFCSFMSLVWYETASDSDWWVDTSIGLSLDFYDNDSICDRSQVQTQRLQSGRHQRVTSGRFSKS